MDNPLKKWIVHTYGSQRLLAEDIGVTSMTVTNWVTKNPEGILKHLSKLRLANADEMMEFMTAVSKQKSYLLAEARR